MCELDVFAFSQAMIIYKTEKYTVKMLCKAMIMNNKNILNS